MDIKKNIFKKPNLSPRKRLTLRSLTVVGLVAVAFFACACRLFVLQVVKAEEYRTKAEENQLYDTTVPARRGTIYDAKGNILAQSASVWLVYVDPGNVPTDDVRQSLCKDLSEKLDMSEDAVMNKLKYTQYRYLVLKRRIEFDKKEEMTEFLSTKYKYIDPETKKEAVVYAREMVGIDPDVKRYYPNNSLASHLLGFTEGSDVGQTGIELYYDDILTGIPGRIVTAKNAHSEAMPLQYETVHDPQTGVNMELTVDQNIQSYLENALEQAYIDNKCASANGIVMDVQTGAILAMATKNDFNLNSPRDLDPNDVQEEFERLQKVRTEKYEAENKKPTDKEIEEGKAADMETATLNVFYNSTRNVCISDTYEPGSVFKTITASAALDQGVANPLTTVTCAPGGISVLNRTYHCNNHTVHGTLDMTGGLTKSCNSYFITMGQRLGVDNFYKYFEAFGFTEKTGIDLPAEAKPVAGVTYHAHESMTIVDLASSSFGQSFQVTPIQMVTALSAIANGGKLMKPYVLAKTFDEDGNVISETKPTVRRQVISSETSAAVAEMMRKVVNEGTAKNGYVIGYRVAGKTGTSQKLSKPGEHVASYGCFAPADDPKIAVIIIIDEPHGGQIQGGQIAAPVAAKVVEDTLKYLNVEPQYTESEIAKLDTTISNFVGKYVNEAVSQLKDKNFAYKVIGNGDKVVSQLPGAYQSIPQGGVVVLYTENGPVNKKTTVPDFANLTLTQVNQRATAAGINVKISGNTLVNSELVAYSQSTAAGEQVDYGTTVTVYFKSNTGVSDLTD